jgi:hypothetical protein
VVGGSGNGRSGRRPLVQEGHWRREGAPPHNLSLAPRRSCSQGVRWEDAVRRGRKAGLVAGRRKMVGLNRLAGCWVRWVLCVYI